MNERIKELWDKVDIQEEGNPPSIVITSERELQEFAELIVKKCALWIELQDEAEHPTAWLLSEELKEHFGVEYYESIDKAFGANNE